MVNFYSELINLNNLGILQPWATYSDFCFVASGLWIFYYLHMRASSSRSRLPMSTMTRQINNDKVSDSVLPTWFWPLNTFQNEEDENDFSRGGATAYMYAIIIIWMGPGKNGLL